MIAEKKLLGMMANLESDRVERTVTTTDITKFRKGILEARPLRVTTLRDETVWHLPWAAVPEFLFAPICHHRYEPTFLTVSVPKSVEF